MSSNKNKYTQRVTIINVTKDNIQINFLSLNIRKSIDEICHYADIKIPFSEKEKINKHDKIKIMYYSKYFSGRETRPITTLLVDEITTTINDNSKTVSVIARSPARDLVDSSYSDTISSMSLLNVVKQIAGKFYTVESDSKIKITAEHYPTNADASPTIDTFNFENESSWNKLLNIAENNNYAIASSQFGNLYVWKKSQRIARLPLQKLVEGQNLKSVEYTENGAYQFSSYTVKGNSNDATVVDSTIKSNRCCCIVMTDSYVSKTELENRAKSEMRKRRCNTLVVTVSGFGLSDEQINKLKTTYKTEVFYEANQVIPVNIPSLKINKDMVIRDVVYNLSVYDFSSTLTLVDEEVIL